MKNVEKREAALVAPLQGGGLEKGLQGPPPPLGHHLQVLANHSAAAVHWLMDEFALDLSQVAQLGGHSAPRTHRGRERFPGLAITYALMDRLEGLAAAGDAVRIVARARVTALLRDEATGAVGGVEYECERRQLHRVNGPVIVATGGFAADFSDSGILRRVRPDLAALPTTNGAHATGDGIRLAQHVGARTVDLDRVQVHPTGLVDPAEPGAKVKPLAAEALRGAGALLLNGAGQRFCDELGRRDYVTQRMRGARGPFRLVLNRRGAAALESHVRHYVSRGLMRRVPSGAALAAEMGVAPNELDATLRTYNAAAAGRLPDPHGKRFFHNAPFAMDEELVVAVVTPVLHYCMGGLEVRPSAEVVGAGGGVIGGLWAAGEVAGGVHGQNRLGGNSLLDCVVFGRIAGEAAARHLLRRALHVLRLSAQHVSQFAGHFADVADAAGDRGAGRARLAVDPEARWLAVNVSWPDRGRRARAAPRAAPPAAKSPAAGRAEGAARAGPADRAQAPLRSYTLAEVARHSTRKDCWVVVNGRVLDVTAFLPMHPGGVQSILIHAGSDVSVPFGMFHRLEMVDKYVPEAVVGVLAADARKRQGR